MQTPKSKDEKLEAPKRKSPTTPIVARQLNKPPQNPLYEKKRPGRVPELEAQLAQLQEDLKKAKKQSESWKRKAREETEEAKREALAMSAKLEDSQAQLCELSSSDDARIQELRKLSQERDRAWQSELEAVHKQHSMAMNEIQKLKAQLKMESKHEELEEALGNVEKLKCELFDCKESEAQAREIVRKTEMQMDIVSSTAELLRSDCIKAKEARKCVELELEESRARVLSLEGLVIELKEELECAKFEVSELRSALEAGEIRYQEEYIKSTLQIRNGFEQVEQAKSEWSRREAQLEAELETLRTNLMENSEVSHETEANLATMLKNLESDLADKEAELGLIVKENEMLKMEITKRDRESDKVNEKAKLEAERSGRVSEELELAQATNAELEAEMRRLKVQSDQWRKAAEAAAAILSSGNNGKIVERTGSLDGRYIATSMSMRMGSPFSEESGDGDWPKRRNGNMLKKIGGLWKKGHY